MHSWASAPDFELDHSFSTHVQLLSAIFSCFYLSPSVFTFSLSILPIFDHLYLFSTVLSQIWVLVLIFTYFLYHFRLLSAIFDHFHSLFIIPTRISSPSTIAIHFRLLLFIFSHFWWFSIILTQCISNGWFYQSLAKYSYMLVELRGQGRPWPNSGPTRLARGQAAPRPGPADWAEHGPALRVVMCRPGSAWKPQLRLGFREPGYDQHLSTQQGSRFVKHVSSTGNFFFLYWPFFQLRLHIQPHRPPSWHPAGLETHLCLRPLIFFFYFIY